MLTRPLAFWREITELKIQVPMRQHVTVKASSGICLIHLEHKTRYKESWDGPVQGHKVDIKWLFPIQQCHRKATPTRLEVTGTEAVQYKTDNVPQSN